MPKFKIALDDGHGSETPGKRTPVLPDGTMMKENEFNKKVIDLLKVHLIRCGFEIIHVSPGDNDIPLDKRVETANKANANFYLSVHANAHGSGITFTDGRGIETFHSPGSVEGKKAATIIHKYLLGGTKLVDRGVKTANFYVLIHTKMPAVLVECAFMTNLEEALLLKSEKYRAECAEELAKGVCEYFKVQYVPNVPKTEEYKMTKEDAEKIIRFLSAAYMATSDKEARSEFNRLANEVRKAANIPTQ